MSDEIEAARMAAEATLHAAWVQGSLSVAAGLVALFGGFFVYRAAVEGAARQVRLAESNHRARVDAYRFRMEVLRDELEGRAAVCFGEAATSLERFRATGGSYSIPMYLLSPIPAFSEQHWEDHAMLGQAEVRSIHDINSKLNRYIEFAREVEEQHLKCDDTATRSSILSHQDRADGGVDLMLARVVEENEIQSRALLDSVKELGVLIKNKQK
jgi:hypothetical protein